MINAREPMPEPRPGEIRELRRAATGTPFVDIAGAMMSAREAQAGWAGTPLRDRLKIIRRARHRIAERAHDLARSVGGARRRTIAETLAAEVLPLAEACRFLEREAETILAPRQLAAKSRPAWLRKVDVEIRRDPFGVVLVIGPSNYPLFLPGVQTLQALVAGNAVALKPGRGGTYAAQALAEILELAGLDPRLLCVLPESSRAPHAAVAAGVDKVVLTGSAATGAAVLADVAPRLVPTVMELSGCDAVFVRADADLDLVVRALKFGLQLNGGATCIAPRRVFVARELAAELEDRLAVEVKQMPAVYVEPAAAEWARELINEAMAEGARLVTGKFMDEDFVKPFVLTGAAPAMRLLQEDLFAPVLSLVSVHDDDAALAAASRCPYALGAVVFGEESGARKLAVRLHAGVVVVNDLIVPTADPRVAFGGRGRSGFGVTRGAEGLLEMTTVKSVVVQRAEFLPHLDGAKASDEKFFQTYITAAHGGTWRQRARAFGSLLRQMAGKALRGRQERRKE